MRSALTIAAIGLVLMGATLALPPVDESTRYTATLVAMLGMIFATLGAIMAIRAQLAPLPPSEEE
jgi:hypothetical protein